jgi:ABC-type nitrate/sulfonate/bicarbonate transport system substrate-binding protein
VKKYIYIFLVCGLVISGSYLGWKIIKQKDGSKPLEKVSVQLDWLNSAEFAGMYAARDKGFYKAAGIDVEFKELPDGLDLEADVAGGKSEFGVATGTEVVYSIAHGDKIRTLAVFYQTTPEVFASLKSTKIKTVADFKGKTLGSTGGNKEAVVLYKALLARAGLKLSDVKMKDLDFSTDVPDDLLLHKADVVDAYRTDETFQMNKKGLVYDQLLPENYGISIYGDCLIASQKFIDGHRDLVKGFVQATIAGWQYALDHQEEALAIIAKYENNTYQNADLEKYILIHSSELVKPTLGTAIGNMNYTDWKQAINAIESAGLIKPGLDPAEVYSTEFLPL